jgi:hypothetical protein
MIKGVLLGTGIAALQAGSVFSALKCGRGEAARSVRPYRRK